MELQRTESRGGYRRNYRNDNLGKVEVGLGIDSTQIISEGIIETVVGLAQSQELEPIEIELDAISVGNVIILLRTVQLYK